MTEAMVVVMVVGVVVSIPLFGLTLRFAVKPVVDAYVRVREVHAAHAADVDRLSARIEQLERILRVRGGVTEGAERIESGVGVASGSRSLLERS